MQGLPNRYAISNEDRPIQAISNQQSADSNQRSAARMNLKVICQGKKSLRKYTDLIKH
jgi:hypothetical protein